MKYTPMYILGFKTQTSLVYEKQSDSCTTEIRLPVKCNILLSSILSTIKSHQNTFLVTFNENQYHYQTNSNSDLTSGTSDNIQKDK